MSQTTALQPAETGQDASLEAGVSSLVGSKPSHGGTHSRVVLPLDDTPQSLAAFYWALAHLPLHLQTSDAHAAKPFQLTLVTVVPPPSGGSAKALLSKLTHAVGSALHAQHHERSSNSQAGVSAEAIQAAVAAAQSAAAAQNGSGGASTSTNSSSTALHNSGAAAQQASSSTNTGGSDHDAAPLLASDAPATTTAVLATNTEPSLFGALAEMTGIAGLPGNSPFPAAGELAVPVPVAAEGEIAGLSQPVTGSLIIPTSELVAEEAGAGSVAGGGNGIGGVGGAGGSALAAEQAAFLQELADLAVGEFGVPTTVETLLPLPGKTGVSDAILRHVASIDASYMILGTRSPSDSIGLLKRPLLSLSGSTPISDTLLARSTCPVLVVRDAQRTWAEPQLTAFRTRLARANHHSAQHTSSSSPGHLLSSGGAFKTSGDLLRSSGQQGVGLGSSSVGVTDGTQHVDSDSPVVQQAGVAAAVLQERRMDAQAAAEESETAAGGEGSALLTTQKGRAQPRGEVAEPPLGQLRICVATDGTNESQYAVQWALEHLATPASRVTILSLPFAVPDAVIDASATSAQVDLDKCKRDQQASAHHAAAFLERAVQVALSHGLSAANINAVVHKPKEGVVNVGTSIADFVKEASIDVVVVDAHGFSAATAQQGTLQRVFGASGSLAEWLTLHLHCPLALVKSTAAEVADALVQVSVSDAAERAGYKALAIAPAAALLQGGFKQDDKVWEVTQQLQQKFGRTSAS